MKHATVILGEFTVPLIGIDPAATEETCDQCHQPKHLSKIKVTLDGKRFLCLDCRIRNLCAGLKLICSEDNTL